MDEWIIYIILINLVGLLLMKTDKNRARQRKWRIPEASLWFVSIIGGSLGTWIGMFLFRHKTKHLSFRIGLPLLIIIQVLSVIML
ncbi:DUF1294 domain-containing protein [Amphibacillus indicireducens]|uniref:DUF1294 domain-containing protein n=1 Tax=Amphibacillus indicireducens TaxID=1076330 RepID=A0ABP7VTU7_9BACI